MVLSSGRGDGRNRYGSGRRRRGARIGRPAEEPHRGPGPREAESAGPEAPARRADAPSRSRSGPGFGIDPASWLAAGGAGTGAPNGEGGAGAGEDPSVRAGGGSDPAEAPPAGSPAVGSDAGESGDAEYERAKEVVLRQLTASARSRAQLEEKLRSKEVSEATIARILDRYEELGLVDDRQYAEMYVRSRAASRKLARPALRRELVQKGIAGELAEEALEQRDEEDEREDARELVRKKLAREGALADRVEREKVTRRLASMLARRGYAPGLAFGIIREELERRGAESPEDAPEL